MGNLLSTLFGKVNVLTLNLLMVLGEVKKKDQRLLPLLFFPLML